MKESIRSAHTVRGMAKRVIRPETVPPAAVALRGGLIGDHDDLRRDALRNFRAYAFYGISVFGLDAAHTRAWVLRNRLRRWETVTILTRAALVSAGLHLVPTGKAPHHDITFEDRDNLWEHTPQSLTELVNRLAAVQGEVGHNEFNTLGGDR